MPLSIRWCRDQDLDALRVFIDDRWQQGHVLCRDEELLRWQFNGARIRAETLEGPSILLGWVGDQIAGMLGVTEFDLCAFGGRGRGAWIQQWYAAPEYRRRNVGLRLLGYVMRFHYDVIFGLAVRDEALRVLRALRFEPFSALPRWIGVFNVEETTALLSEAAESRDDASVIQSTCEACFVGDSPVATGDGRTSGWTPEVAEQWSELWWRTIGCDFMGAARDSDFLHWRYIEHPRFNYVVRFSHSSSGTVNGLLVYRIETIRGRDEKVMRILELLALDDDAAALQRDIVTAARQEGVAYSDYYCASDRSGSLLESLGFRPEDSAMNGITFPSRLQPLDAQKTRINGAFLLPTQLRGRLDHMWGQGQLYVTKADSDQDRPN